MELNYVYKFYYNFQGEYITGTLIADELEYYVLQNASIHIARAQGFVDVSSHDQKCYVYKRQIRYAIKESI